MKDSTARALRTAFDVAAGVLAVALVAIPFAGEFGVPTENTAAALGYVVAGTALVSKVRNKLEELGWIPAVLKGEPDPTPVENVVPAPAEVPAEAPASDVVIMPLVGKHAGAPAVEHDHEDPEVGESVDFQGDSVDVSTWDTER